MKSRLTIGAALVLLAIVLPVAPASAQPYPSKPIKLIVDGPAGGINDIWARRYAQRISEAMQQTIVVENRPGASGTIAAEAVAKSTPDGYTMFFGGMNPLVAYPGAGGLVRYDPVRDFVPVAVSTMGYPAFVVNSGLGIKTLADLVERAKAKPDEFICGTSGQASVQHFACVKAAEALGVEMRTVPYKGGSAALMDAAAGQIQVSVGYTAELEPHMAEPADRAGFVCAKSAAGVPGRAQFWRGRVSRASSCRVSPDSLCRQAHRPRLSIALTPKQ